VLAGRGIDHVCWRCRFKILCDIETTEVGLVGLMNIASRDCSERELCTAEELSLDDCLTLGT
jgi:hypothetical protein